MPTFKTDRDRFIGGTLRKAGAQFSLDYTPKPLPKGLTLVGGMTPQQKAAETRKKKQEEADRKAAEAELKSAGVGKSGADYVADEGEITVI